MRGGRRKRNTQDKVVQMCETRPKNMVVFRKEGDGRKLVENEDLKIGCFLLGICTDEKVQTANQIVLFPSHIWRNL